MQISKVALKRQHQREFCVFIEAVLSAAPLFRVLIRRMKIAHGGLRGIQSAVLAGGSGGVLSCHFSLFVF